MKMKNKVLFVFIVLLMSVRSFAQELPVEYFSSPVVWLGLDYSHTKMIGAQGFSNPDQIVTYYFENWNKLVMTESGKYDLNNHLVANVTIDLKHVRAKNKTVDHKTMVVEEAAPFTDALLEEIVSGYDSTGLSGFGAMMIVEAYNKNMETATYHFVVLDLESQTIIYKKKYTTAPSGFGFRNYWAATFLRALKGVENDLNSILWNSKKPK